MLVIDQYKQFKNEDYSSYILGIQQTSFKLITQNNKYESNSFFIS